MFSDLISEGREFAVGRLANGQTLPDTIDVTAAKLSEAMIASETSAPLGEWVNARSMVIHALADVWTSEAGC